MSKLEQLIYGEITQRDTRVWEAVMCIAACSTSVASIFANSVPLAIGSVTFALLRLR